MTDFSEVRRIAWNVVAEIFGLTINDVITGASASKFLRGDGTWSALGAATGLTMATARLLGRTTAGAGAVEEITVGAGLSLAAGALTATASTAAPVRATADQSVNNGGTGTTLTNATGLSFSIAANEEWVAEFYLDTGARLDLTGIKVAVTTPSGATQNFVADIICDITGAEFSKRTTASGTALDFTIATIGTNGSIHCSLWVLNGATPGTVQIQFAQSTASATNLTIRKGSHGVPIKIA